MFRHLIHTLAAAALLSAAACSDGNIGTTLSDNTIKIVDDSSFTITGQSVAIPFVKSRSTTQLLGAISSPDYGTLTSEVVTALMPASKLVTDSVYLENITGARLLMFITARNGFTGDSIAPMRMSVYPLAKELPSPIYSSFSPQDYYDPAQELANTSYSASDMERTSTERASHFLSYFNSNTYSYNYSEIREVRVDLPKAFGVSLFKQYLDHPETFSTPQRFGKFMPGLYIKNTYGSGRMMNFYDVEVELTYKRLTKTKAGKDTLVADSARYLAATPEVVSANLIRMTPSPSIQARVAAGEALLLAPQGYATALHVPLRQMVDKYNLDNRSFKVINEMTLDIPAEAIANDYGIKPPTNVLLIRQSEQAAFFDGNKLADDARSYVATYNATTKKYSFTGMRKYLYDIMDKAGGPDADDENLVLIPVDVTSETLSSSYSYYYSDTQQTVTTKIAPSVMAPAMARIDLSRARLHFSYTGNSMGGF